jgi:hypothetical protein
MMRWWMNDELQRSWKKVVVEVLAQNLPLRLEENHEAPAG